MTSVDKSSLLLWVAEDLEWEGEEEKWDEKFRRIGLIEEFINWGREMNLLSLILEMRVGFMSNFTMDLEDGHSWFRAILDTL